MTKQNVTGWRKRQVMEMARKAGIGWAELLGGTPEFLEVFAELVRADEAEKYKWDVHSCGPTCTKVGCVAVRKAVEAEREACAKVCEESFEYAGDDLAQRIRARGQA